MNRFFSCSPLMPLILLLTFAWTAAAAEPNDLDAREAFTFKGHKNAVTRLAFHPRSRYLASGGEDGDVLL